MSLKYNICHFPGISQCHVHLSCLSVFSSQPWVTLAETLWFCRFLCIVLQLATVYDTFLLRCLHIVLVLSVSLLPFIYRSPKGCHTNNLKVAGASLMLFLSSMHGCNIYIGSTSDSIMLLCLCYVLISRDSFSPP